MLAVALHAQGTTNEARQHLQFVVAKRPIAVRWRLARGMIACMDNRHTDAVAELSQALTDPVLRPLALEQRARSWLGIGHEGIKAALTDADTLARLLPKEGLAQLQAARIYALAAKGLPQKEAAPLAAHALKLLDQAVQLSPGLRNQLAGDASFDSLRKSPNFPNPAKEP